MAYSFIAVYRPIIILLKHTLTPLQLWKYATCSCYHEKSSIVAVMSVSAAEDDDRYIHGYNYGTVVYIRTYIVNVTVTMQVLCMHGARAYCTVYCYAYASFTKLLKQSKHAITVLPSISMVADNLSFPPSLHVYMPAWCGSNGENCKVLE